MLTKKHRGIGWDCILGRETSGGVLGIQSQPTPCVVFVKYPAASDFWAHTIYPIYTLKHFQFQLGIRRLPR